MYLFIKKRFLFLHLYFMFLLLHLQVRHKWNIEKHSRKFINESNTLKRYSRVKFVFSKPQERLMSFRGFLAWDSEQNQSKAAHA